MLDDPNYNPDPSKCPVPELLPSNVIAVELFQLVRDQYIVAGLGSVVGINKVALLEVIKLYGNQIDEPTECFEKMCVLAHLEVEHINEVSKQHTETKQTEEPTPKPKQRPSRAKRR